jgi:hypothetical protein
VLTRHRLLAAFGIFLAVGSLVTCGRSPVLYDEGTEDAGPPHESTTTGGSTGGASTSESSSGSSSGGRGRSTGGRGGGSNGGFGGSNGGLGGLLDSGIVDCGICVFSSCGTDFLTCLQDTSCATSLQCVATTCLTGGSLDPACLLGCAGGSSATLLSLVTCVAGTCGSTCLSALGGLGGGGGIGGGGGSGGGGGGPGGNGGGGARDGG